MASSKIILYTSKKKKDGTHPLVLRIIQNRKPRYIFLKHWIKKTDWNEVESRVRKSHPNNQRLNNLLIKKLAEAGDVVIENETKQKIFSSGSVKKQLLGFNSNTTFFQFAAEYINDLFKQKKYTVAGPERSRIKRFRDFFNNTDISFTEVNVASLNKFKVHLVADGMSKKSVMNHLITIRTLFNKAIKEGIADKSLYPFGGDKIKVQRVDGLKIGLEKEELQAIIDLDYPANSQKWHTRNIYLISFFFAGARISDVLKMKWSDVHSGRLNYQMGKNTKPVSIKIPDQAQQILDAYLIDKQFPDDYVFPDLKIADPKDKLATIIRIRTTTKRLNKYLAIIAADARITKKLTNHIARHTFGNLAGNRIPITMLQKLYRHSSILTTAVYQGNFMHKETDEALDAVVNF
jgi:integrase/recombinase XerD